MRNVISVPEFGLDKTYLSWPEEQRKETCKKIVEQAFSEMKVPSTKKQRKSVLSGILDNSIVQYEILDKFEECQILLDLKNALALID